MQTILFNKDQSNVCLDVLSVNILCAPARSPALRSPRHSGAPRRHLITPIPGNNHSYPIHLSPKHSGLVIQWFNKLSLLSP